MIAVKKIHAFGENGLIATFEDPCDLIASGIHANKIADDLRAHPGITDAIAGIDSIVIRFEVGALSPDDARALLENAATASITDHEDSADIIDIPVAYGGAHGPDFDALCKITGLSADALIATHSNRIYKVATLGFAPGFAYMGPIDEALQVDRLDHPRARLPAGAVGLAGPFTAVYPLPSPGGWRIIGRTPKSLFNPYSDDLFPLRPGAQIRFTPLPSGEWETAFSS